METRLVDEGDRFVVTGAGTPVGAWVVRELLAAGIDVIALDGSADDHRLRLVTSDDDLARLTRLAVDLLDPRGLRAAMSGATHVVHVDAVTAEDCDEDPAAAAVDVVAAAAAVFGAAGDVGIDGLSFCSSMAVFSPAAEPVGPGALPEPSSALGALRRATEMVAAEVGAHSITGIIGLRTNLVYGPGQDRGRIAEPTMAMAAVVNEQPLHVGHDGSVDFQFVGDVARALVGAARAATRHRGIYNLSGTPMSISEFLRTVAISNGDHQLTVGEDGFSLPVATPDPQLDDVIGSWSPRSVPDGVRETVEVFRWAPRDLYLPEAI